MIKPTVGRVVWYRPSEDPIGRSSDQPLAAMVTYVHADTLVNLMVIDPNGNPYSRTSIYLQQEDAPPAMEGVSYCEWMPYQKGQAAKTEELEAKISS